ncbi:MAG: class I tRNA ligase family protein, partial [Chloroflexi bacterium]|nr:class I tRNA ligase family protein [Chloroflexota bacterium]
RDEKGEKMSKMRGNVINPTDAIEKYGTDALRFAITTGTAPGNDVNLGEHRLEAGRNFANKIWNASRFVLQSIDTEVTKGHGLKNLSVERPEIMEDRWILSRLNRLIISVDKLMEEYQFGEAERQLNDFFWGEFCDWYIEIAKIRLTDSESSPLPVLAFVLETVLRLLHPFMPFITEELWQGLRQRLPKGVMESDSIVIAPYPVGDESFIDVEAERVMESVVEIIRSIRNARAEHKVAPAKWVEARVYADNLSPAIAAQSKAIEVLAKAKPLAVLSRGQRQAQEEKALVFVLKEAEVVLPLAGMVDVAAERKRLGKEIEGMQGEIVRLTQRLGDRAFTSKAPAAVVEKERNKLETLKDKLQRLQQEMGQLG